MHNRKLEDPMKHEIAGLESDVIRIVGGSWPTRQKCTHPNGRVESAIASVCVDCGDSEPGWLVRRVQALEDEVTQLRESVRPENR